LLLFGHVPGLVHLSAAAKGHEDTATDEADQQEAAVSIKGVVALCV